MTEMTLVNDTNKMEKIANDTDKMKKIKMAKRKIWYNDVVGYA
jgi:hypothetical protein